MGKIVTRAKATVCGQPKENWLAISFELSSEQEEIKSMRGRLFGVLEIRDQSSDPNPLLSKKSIEVLEQDYFQSGESSNLAAFKKAIESLSRTPGVVSGAFVVIREDISYLTVFGDGRILIWRQNQLTPILEDVRDIQTASGKITTDDLLILQTQSFGKIIDDKKIITNLDHRPVAEIAEGLLPEILKDADSSGAAALFLQFNVEDKDEDERSVLPPIETLPIKTRLNFSKLSIFISKLLSKLPKTRRDLYLRRSAFEENKKHIKLIFTGFVFIFLLLAIIYQIRLQKIKEANSEFNRVYSAAQSQLNSRQNLFQAKQSLIDFVVKKYGKNWAQKKDQEIQKLKILISQIDEAYLVNPVLFYDLSLLKDQAGSTNAVIKDSNIRFLDGTSGTIFSLDTKTKSGTIISGDDAFKNAASISVRADWVYLFGTEGVYRIDTVKNKKELIIKKDEKLQEIISQISFAGNLYFLDKRANRIWKYIATETGFSDTRSYLNPDIKPDFSKAVSMDIDGSVYVLKTDGGVLKFTQGLPENFALTGLDGSLNSPGQIIVTDNYFYIHDKGNRRVVIFNKKGEYYSQYQIGGDFAISQVLVDESSRQLFLISGGKVYTIILR